MGDKMNYEVIDDFLSIEDFSLIKNTMFDTSFPWFYYKTKTFKDEKETPYNFQFVHNFYANYGATSNFIELLSPLITKINPIAIAKIKANMTMKTEKIIEYGYHTDYETNNNLKTAVFYLNNNDGYTKFKGGPSIDSIENRLLIFDSQLSHTGTSCTDQRFRSVINFNFYK
jgi:hypothetical protein